MKTLSLIAALALGGLMACTASAQTNAPAHNRRGRMSVERQVERLTTELNLTDAQKPKVEAVLKDLDKQRHAIYGPDSTVPEDQRREKMRATMQDEEKQFKSILTPDQYSKWQKMRAEMRNRRPGHKNGTGSQNNGQ